MSGLNKCMLIGHLGKDPEMRYTQNGSAVTSFSVATSNMRDGKEYTEWHNVVTWNKTAESCAQYLAKGKKVYVEGRLSTNTWEKDGVKHYKTEVVAQTVLFLSPQGNGGGQPAGDWPDEGDVDLDDVPFS